MGTIEKKAMAAKNDSRILEEFIREYEPFILASAAKTAKHHISKSDDEWSIALIAFYDAVKGFDKDKGGFLSYAKLVIRSRLIDYFRMQGRHNEQISIELINEQDLVENQEDASFHDEIAALGQTLDRYGFSFMDLASCSPKAGKTRKACKDLIRYMLDSPILIRNMQTSLRLPIKALEKNTPVPRKIIERHRKYIMTAVEILTGDYPKLSEYFSYIRKDEQK